MLNIASACLASNSFLHVTICKLVYKLNMVRAFCVSNSFLYLPHCETAPRVNIKCVTNTFLIETL